MAYLLVDKFQALFAGVKYNHRISNQGDRVASYLFEDLYALGRSKKFNAAVSSQSHVANTANKQVGKAARRGDGTFGERVPNADIVLPPGLSVAIGAVATIEIGSEVKLLAKAMIKQIDRVGTDMKNQVDEFKKHGGKPICIGIVGINHAAAYTSYEKNAVWPTDGKTYKHPIQEAVEAEVKLVWRVANLFDEFLVLRFRASNVPPYPFDWVDLKSTESHYGAALLRIAIEYDKRF